MLSRIEIFKFFVSDHLKMLTRLETNAEKLLKTELDRERFYVFFQ